MRVKVACSSLRMRTILKYKGVAGAPFAFVSRRQQAGGVASPAAIKALLIAARRRLQAVPDCFSRLSQ